MTDNAYTIAYENCTTGEVVLGGAAAHKATIDWFLKGADISIILVDNVEWRWDHIYKWEH